MSIKKTGQFRATTRKGLFRQHLLNWGNGPLRSRKMLMESLEDRRVLAVVVEAFSPTPNGFSVDLSEEIRLSNLNLYDSQSAGMGAADVTLRGATVGDVRGSLVVDGTRMTFIASSGLLAPDTYTATLRSAADSIVDAALGQLLDGEFNGQFPSGNGVPGGDFVFNFNVNPTPQIVVGIPSFARGPAQSVNVPAVGSGQATQQDLPIQFSETAGITSLTMTITYDPNLLNVTDVKRGPSAPAGSQVEANLTVPGQIILAFFSLEPLPGGPADLLVMEASVPEDAPYGSAQIMRVQSVEINAGQLNAVGKDAVHVVAFMGDVNGNRRYDAEDARLVARVGVGLDSGFVGASPEGTGIDQVRPFATIDPVIIGDVTGLEGISALDASDILRRVVGLPTPNIPSLPIAQPPTGISLSSTSFSENLTIGSVVGTFTTSDPDVGDTHTYALIAGSGDNDNAKFAINGNTLTTATLFDFNIQNTFSIRVQTTDSTGRTFQRIFNLSLSQQNQAPSDIGLSNLSIAENQPNGTLVGNFSTIDPNTGDTHTYTLVAGEGSTDNAAFAISGSQLVTAQSFDFETKSSYSIRVRSTDAGGLFVEKNFLITVTDVNEVPTSIALDNSSLVSPVAANGLVGVLSTIDPDAGDSHIYTLVVGDGDEDNASFSISGNEVRAAVELDMAQQASYSIRVRSTDSGGLFVEQFFVITLTDGNAAPTDIELSNLSVAENEPAGTVVGDFSTIDPNAGDTHVYTLVSGDGDQDNGSFDIVSGQLVTVGSFDFETKSSYSIRVRSTDAGGLFVEKNFLITVTDVNEVPTSIALDNSSLVSPVAANGLVGVLSTIDPDAGDSHIYTLVVGDGDEDNASFSISGNEVRAAVELDMAQQASYSIRVRSTDSGGLFVEQFFVITLTDGNAAPTDIELSNLSVAENEPAGTVVGDFSTIDPNAGDTHVYTLVSGDGDQDNGSFDIVSDQLVTVGSFDFETKSSYSIRVRSTDAGGLFVEKNFLITVTDVNEAPTEIALDNNTVPPGSFAGIVVGFLSTVDPDENDSHVYTLVVGDGDDDNALFVIVGNQLRTAVVLNFDPESSYTVRIRSTDADGLFIEQVFVVFPEL